MSEDSRTLWVGNLDERVTEELIYELCLQTGPVERLVLPTEGEGEEKKHKGHAYVVFVHPESVQYASQVLEGSSLFSNTLTMKARALPVTYKKSTPTHSAQGGRGRFDNSSLRGGFNKSNTWHGQNDFIPRGRGGNFKSRGGGNNFNQQNNYSSGSGTSFNNYNSQQSGSSFWMGGQQQSSSSDNQVASYSTSNSSLEEKRQRLLQQQNLTLEAHRQIQQGLQQGVMNMATQMYGMTQQQQQPGTWSSNGYNNSGNWNMGSGGDTNSYQGYTTDQYGNWFQQQ